MKNYELLWEDKNSLHTITEISLDAYFPGLENVTNF